MSKITVLVVDDHAIVRDAICNLLNCQPDMECISASDGPEAVALAAIRPPDVAIVDVSMPEMNGIDVVTQLKKEHPSTVALMLSAYGYDEYIVAAMGAKADGYLLKSNLPGSSLVDAVRTARSGKFVFDREASSGVLQRACSRNTTKGTTHGGLAPRELEVLTLAARGQSNKEIAKKLGISQQTVGAHLVHIFKKLGVQSRLEAIVYGVKRGWFRIE